MPTRSEKVMFTGSQGDDLAARLDLPSGGPAAYALFAHCFTCSKDVFAASRISRDLTRHGIGVLRFDFTGLGHSEGEFANTNFTSNVEDLVLAADWLRREREAPKLLIGHSLGGAAVLRAAGDVPEADAVVTIGSPFSPAHVGRLFEGVRERIEAGGQAEVELAGRRFTIRKQFLDDIEDQPMQDAIAGLRKPLLVFHAPLDDTAGVDNARLIFEAAKHPKSFVSLDSADHLLTDHRDAVYVADVLAAWVSRYLGLSVHEQTGERVARGEVLVRESDDGIYAQVIVAGPHLLRADEPPDTGDDTGPSPYDLLLAGLGACTSMTVRMYADRKQIPLERASVRLRHDRIHAEDCADCETTAGMVDRIERVLEVEGDLTDEQRERLLSIAERCPVHRTLTGEVRIETRLAD